MIARLRAMFSFLLVLAVFGGVLWACFATGRWFLGWLFDGLQKEVAAGITAALIMVVGSIASILLTKRFEREANIRKELQGKKASMYDESTEFWLTTLMASKAGKEPPSEQQIIEYLTHFTGKLIVWGSDSVLKSFLAFRESAAPREEEVSLGVIQLFADYLLEIRKDMGHENSDICRGDILALFVNDIRERMEDSADTSPPGE
jgi:hypothetical protein